MLLKLKICGMREPANIAAVAALQPQYMGFIFYEKSKRYVANLSPEFLTSLTANICKTGVFVNEDSAELIKLVERYHLSAVQLHGQESPEYCQALKASLPEVEIIKAFGVGEDFNFEQLTAYQGLVDFFLFDTQTPDHGGSGKLFNWDILKNYPLTLPFFLSGGIGLEHVTAISALKLEHLYGIDVNSKFELSPGLKDLHQLTAFKLHLFPDVQNTGIH